MTKSTGMSRRAFVGGALAGSATLAMGLSACAPEGQAGAAGGSDGASSSCPSFLNAPEAIAESDITETKEADVVVVGCGMAGMAAARAVIDEGASVIVIEKSIRFNCRGTMGAQIGSVGSRYQKEAGYPEIDRATLLNRYMQDTLQMANQSLLAYWFDHSGEDVEWFLDLCDNVILLKEGESVPEGGLNGNVYLRPSTESNLNGRYPTFATSMSFNFDTSFPDDAGFYYPMLNAQKYIEENGGEFLYSTWGRQLIKDGERVVAVIAQDENDQYIRINAAKAVILSCGDFGNNKEMIQYYAPQALDLNCTYNSTDAKGEPCNMGEGHQMALWAGAAMEKAPYAPMSHLTDVSDILLVDKNGNRFINEELGAQSLCNVVMRCPGSIAYCITGTAQGPKVLQPGPGAVAPDPLNSIEEAAEVIGCNTDTLKTTIDRYNQLASAGEDTDFGKSAEALIAIESPFYVYESHPGDMLVMLGGIDCDTACRALDATGNPVPGLYVAGNTQGCRFGAEYPMTAPGISHGLALTLGRLAGKNAATLM